MGQYKYDAFLSYPTKEAAAVELLAEKLRSAGVDTFWDKRLPPGSDLVKDLAQALEESRKCVVFIGSEGTGRGQQVEIDRALQKARRDPEATVIPVLLPGARDEDVPLPLRTLLWVDFREGVENARPFQVLLEALLLQRAAAPVRSLFEQLSPAARAAILRADSFRRSLARKRIHMEHLLVGLFDGGGSRVRHAFELAGIDRPRLQELLDGAGLNVPGVDPYVPSNARELPPLSKHAGEALELARKFAEASQAGEIGTEHLLHGAFGIADCEVVKLLASQRVKPLPLLAPEPPGRPEFHPASSGDQPARDDKLGFDRYVLAVARFLQSEQTRPPLTLSIEGTWGSGKSSFMLQLEEMLRQGCRLWPWLKGLRGRLREPRPPGVRSWLARLRKELRPPCCLIVRFNAWRHDKEDALWAAFASEFLRRIARQRFLPRRWLGHFHLFLGRYHWRDGWLEMLRAAAVWSLLVALAVYVPLSVYARRDAWTKGIHRQLADLGILSATPEELAEEAETPAATGPGKATDKASELRPVFQWLVSLGGLGAYAAGVISLFLKAKDIVGNPLQIHLRQYLRSPDYEGRVAFVESFHEDFRKIVDAYAGDYKVFVFIDDLDRCEVPKAADLMQAINLLISDDPRLIFIIGMDREKVAAGLAVKYEKLLPYVNPEVQTGAGQTLPPQHGLDFGYEFIEKFVQVPFSVPAPRPENLDEFLAVITNGRPSGPVPRPWRWPVLRRRSGAGRGETAAAARETAPADPALHPGPSRSARREAPAAGAELSTQAPGEPEMIREIVHMVAPSLDYNPRRLKQFVNLFRLRAYIAESTGLLTGEAGGPPAVALEQLGKFVTITLLWPGLVADLIRNKQLLQQLEDIALGRHPAGSDLSPAVARWQGHQTLMTLLRYGCREEEGRAMKADPVSYSLGRVDPDHLLRVAAPPARRPAPSPG